MPKSLHPPQMEQTEKGSRALIPISKKKIYFFFFLLAPKNGFKGVAIDISSCCCHFFGWIFLLIVHNSAVLALEAKKMVSLWAPLTSRN